MALYSGRMAVTEGREGGAIVPAPVWRQKRERLRETLALRLIHEVPFMGCVGGVIRARWGAMPSNMSSARRRTPQRTRRNCAVSATK